MVERVPFRKRCCMLSPTRPRTPSEPRATSWSAASGARARARSGLRGHHSNVVLHSQRAYPFCLVSIARQGAFPEGETASCLWPLPSLFLCARLSTSAALTPHTRVGELVGRGCPGFVALGPVCVFDFTLVPLLTLQSRRVCLLLLPALSTRLPSAALLYSDASPCRGEGVGVRQVVLWRENKQRPTPARAPPLLLSSCSAHVPFSLALCGCRMAAATEAPGGQVSLNPCRVVTVCFRRYGKGSDSELLTDRVRADTAFLASITSLVGAENVRGIAFLLRDAENVLVSPLAVMNDPSITTVTVEFREQISDSRLMTGCTPQQRGVRKRPFGASFTGLEGKDEEEGPPMRLQNTKRTRENLLAEVRRVLARLTHLSASSTYVFARRLMMAAMMLMTTRRKAMRRVRRRRRSTSMRAPRLGAYKPRRAGPLQRERTAICCSPRARIAWCGSCWRLQANQTVLSTTFSSSMVCFLRSTRVRVRFSDSSRI